MSHSMASMTHPMAMAIDTIGSSLSLGLHQTQGLRTRLAVRIKVRRLTNAYGAVAGTLTKIHVVKGRSVESATVVPNS